MRVLSISTLFPNSARSSFGIFVANQMRAVAARDDVDLTMISPVGLPPWPLSLRAPYGALRAIPEHTADTAGLPVHYPRFRLIPRIGGDSNPHRIVRAIAPLVEQLHSECPFDVLDAQFFFPDGPAAGALAARLNLPFSIKARGADIHFWGSRPKAREQMMRAAAEAAGLLAVSDALRDDMIALGMPADRICVHYTGLDHQRFKPIERGAARVLLSAIPNLGIPEAGPLIVTAGALIPRKGQRFVIEALSRLPDARLALAGTGEDEQELRALSQRLGVADRVHFLGNVSHDQLPSLLSAADVMALASSSEGIANVWIEALGCGTPIVITDAGGAREVVKVDSAGRIAARDGEAIAAAIRDILANPPSQNAVAANAGRFSWESSAAKLVEYWRSLLKP